MRDALSRFVWSLSGSIFGHSAAQSRLTTFGHCVSLEETSLQVFWLTLLRLGTRLMIKGPNGFIPIGLLFLQSFQEP
jgi:hypothetical protein